jgi:beta-lactamase class D
MYKDIITYELAENKSKEDLLKIAKQIVNDWMKNQPGFIKWEIHTNTEQSFTDIVYWESKEAAKKAEKEMVNIPHAGDWYSCYKEGSISSKNLELIAEF